ncbi:3-(3-hydroxy-phenyl)propionate hydroxylase [Hasllibacter halocynthiae]|uniref:3-(3-hydroxy-phenyl)propionate hydroxylase n=1 Tax=Hasllibacter halocynthiae TaxID=595589 RepID=A0A2T0X1N9_9RHOB|nr:FAD-dependent monooxygenase [Hasllibacter halocynthiae]PRY92873.1 3-(3-hydroxy-phenyl)propionate hydroxylase [Hasllibacter halocynthiae]
MADGQPFPARRPPGLDAPEPRHPVAIVGAGPVGLLAALELARFGCPSVLLDDNDRVCEGSRAICWSKRSLEIMDRVGLGEGMARMGVTWKVGRTFHGDSKVFEFDLLPEDGHKMPAFVNLPQHEVERMLVERAEAEPLVDLRFRNRVAAVRQDASGATLAVETDFGPYELSAGWLLACDGARSPIRRAMGLDFDGELFEERFLIADIAMDHDMPDERHFWFEPTFHPGQSALMHKQPGGIYRIDLQLGWDADPDAERTPEIVIPRIEKVVGHRDFRLEWTSVYTFHCRRLARFRHGRVLFVGDSAHVVSPFGARGGNGGLQDVDALGWRLAAVVAGEAGNEALDHWDAERQHAADENIANSSRATRFMTPREGAERVYRDQVLRLAARAPFARPMVNSGRLSAPCAYPAKGAEAALPEVSAPGRVAPDAPLPDGWLSERLRGWTLLGIGARPPRAEGMARVTAPAEGPLAERYLGAAARAVILVRPDGVVAARWDRAPSAAEAEAERDALLCR